MTRTERRQRRKQQTIRRVAACVGAGLFLLACILLLTGGTDRAEGDLLPTVDEPAEVEQQESTAYDTEAADPLQADKEALARMVYGEARGCSKTEQAAVVWCALNRFDSGDPFYAGCYTVRDIVTQANQFYGYSPDNPLDPEIMALVEDVLVRWMAERCCIGSVGRVLPADYLYFTGDGKTNTFTTAYRGGETWDWSLESPYWE